MHAILYTTLGILTGIRDAVSNVFEWLVDRTVRLVIVLLIIANAFAFWRLSSVDGDRDDWRTKAEEYEAAAKAVAEANIRASEDALITAAETMKDIDDANERAREDARGSDDPLRAGLDRLRAEGANRRD